MRLSSERRRDVRIFPVQPAMVEYRGFMTFTCGPLEGHFSMRVIDHSEAPKGMWTLDRLRTGYT